jgi:hypothetical protein
VVCKLVPVIYFAEASEGLFNLWEKQITSLIQGL